MSCFGKRLKVLREEKGDKQEDLANLLGVSRGAISKYENNDREPDMKTIVILTDYFGVTIDYLFGRIDTRNTPDYISKNIKLIMENHTVEEFILHIKEKVGITLKASDVDSYLKGKTAPSLSILQALADYAGVYIEFFYRNNDKKNFQKEKELTAKDCSKYPDKNKIETFMKNRSFMRLAMKIKENNLDIASVEKLIDSAIKIKGSK